MAYVYRHIRLDNNVPFYIGIGNENDGKYSRAFENKVKKRNIYWQRIVNKTAYEVEIMLDNLTWECACEKEKEFIKLYGRGNKGEGTLSNMTDGGDGVLGIIMPTEMREKMSLRTSKPIAQYDLDGIFIKSYKSATAAAKLINSANSTAICSCANLKNDTANGFIWRWDTGNKNNIEFNKEDYFFRRFGKRKVSVYTKEGKFINVYKDLKDASGSLNISLKSIHGVLMNNHIATNGLIFRYNNGDTDNIDVSKLYKDKKGKNSPMFGRTKENSCRYGISGKDHWASKQVAQICHKTKEVINVYENVTIAATENKIDNSGISKCCRGILKKVGGYNWKYI